MNLNCDLVYQHLHQTEHLYYLFGSSSKRIMTLMDHILVLTRNWNFHSQTLAHLNFGDNFIGYVKTIYNNIESTILNNIVLD